MSRVASNDGTSIAYERIGDGPAVILVGGGAVDRSENAPLAAELAGGSLSTTMTGAAAARAATSWPASTRPPSAGRRSYGRSRTSAA